MFDSSYPFLLKNKTHKHNGELSYVEHIYTFETKKHITYLVHVEEYMHQVFFIKFFQKNHSLSDDKYRFLTKDGEMGAKVRTCLNIMLEIYRCNPDASFGFIGINSLVDESIQETKRYTIYKDAVANLFSPVSFEHFIYKAKSAYVLINKNKIKTSPTLVIDIEKALQNALRDLE